MISKTYHRAIYTGTQFEWGAAIDWFEANGEKRLGATIWTALKNQAELVKYVTDFPIGVSLRDGSIAKMDAYLRGQDL